MARYKIIILTFALWGAALSCSAQSMTSSIGAALNMNSRSAYNSGLSATNMTLTLSSLLSLIWRVTVQASGPFTSGSNSIPLNTFSMAVVSGTPTAPSGIGAVTTYFSPTTTAQNILNANLLSLLQSETLTIGYKFSGGTAYFVPAGTYTTTLTFNYINALGILQATTSLVVSIIITSTINLAINNGGSATMSFSTLRSYTNPTPLVQSQAINVFSTLPYAITVEASTDLTNGAGATIAVNKFSLGALADPTATGVTGSTVTLSHTTSGTIATSTIASLGQAFDLTFAALAAASLVGNTPSTYSTVLTLTATEQ
jgi:hypothetical protein